MSFSIDTAECVEYVNQGLEDLQVDVCQVLRYYLLFLSYEIKVLKEVNCVLQLNKKQVESARDNKGDQVCQKCAPFLVIDPSDH